MTGPKKIFVLCGGDEQETATLELAIDLAKAHKASLECWHVAPDPYGVMVPSMAMGGVLVYPDAVIGQMEKDNKESAAFAQRMVMALSRQKKFESVSFQSVLGDPEHIATTRGRLADLIVMSRTGRNINFPSAMNGALFGSGRPVLMTPPGKKGKSFNGKVLIAWNGSREATHAVTAALPYLTSEKVWILVEKEKKSSPLSASELSDYLKRHGISANILLDMDSKNNLPGSILQTAMAIDAGMVVMGAWGHSRFREYVFGGVTSYMLENADIPVFMAH